MSNKKELLNKLKELKKEVINTKGNLSKINKEKEEWFTKKESLKQEIKISINKLKTIKKEKDSSYSKINELKKQRNEYNKKVKGLIKEIQRLKHQEISEFKRSSVEHPSKLQRKVEKLKSQIETEAISFKKEKELMEKIKKYQKGIKENLKFLELSNKQREISDKIKEAKKKADEFHEKILESLKQGEGYKFFIKSSQEITALRKNQEKAFDQFVRLKRSFRDLNIELRKKLKEIKSIQESFDGIKLAEKAKDDKENDMLIENKRIELENKFKKGKKITTEDLLSIQRPK